jgi:DNA-binding LacI/PurR family transcriptional regulator
MKRCIRRMVERKAEGVAIMTFGIEEPLLEQLADRNVPLVFVDVGPDKPGISLLQVDYYHGIRQGVQHLAALGASRYCIYLRAAAASLGALASGGLSPRRTRVRNHCG